VVDRDAVVESALIVEVDDLLYRVRRLLFTQVVEGAAVTERSERRPIRVVEPKETANPESVKPMPLRKVYLLPRPSTSAFESRMPVYGAGEITSCA
jgi:hypothetical protein